MNNQCCVCLEEEENDNNTLILYNHCGMYYIHSECLYKWEQKYDDCFICRQNLKENNNGYSIFNDGDTVFNDRDNILINISSSENISSSNNRVNSMICTTTISFINLMLISIYIYYDIVYKNK